MKRLARVAGMSLHELYTRGRQGAARRRDALLGERGADPFRIAGTPELRGLEKGECAATIEMLRRRLPQDVEATIARAGRVLEGRFELLGYEGLDFGRDIDWSFDPVHRKRAPYAPWPRIDFLKFEDVGDHKIVWELNRHQWMGTLARAYRFTGERRYAACLEELWYDWRRKNPYPMGINWASALEVAFRAMSWLWVALWLEGTAAWTGEFPRDLALETARAAWYIERFLSTYFSPNTHLLGEAVALFLIGTRYPGWRASALWRRNGWRIAMEESRRQVREDGFYFEQSTYYHVYALDLLLHARSAAVRTGMAIPGEFDRTLRKMLRALASLARGGALPRFGDDDGGRVFDGARNRPEHMLDPLSTGAALFQDAGVIAAAPGPIEETLWLLGPEVEHTSACSPEKPERGEALESSGIYSMLSPGPPRAQLFIDAGEQGALNAGHGHADALSVQLAAAGRLWLGDPGTGCYVDAAGSRDWFRGTRAHNTLAVDRLDQAAPAGPFAWGPRPTIGTRRWESGPGYQVWEGFHSGYERLAGPVTHRRWVVGFGAGLWLVRDVAEGRGTHEMEIAWHFPPEIRVFAREQVVVGCAGGEALALVPVEDPAWEVDIEAEEYSPAYGSKVAAQTVRWRWRGEAPAEFAIAIGFGAAAAEARLRRTEGGNGGTAKYVCITGLVPYQFVFAIDGSVRVL